MHTTTKEKAHGCDPVSFQNDTTKRVNFLTTEREGKAIAFANLAARFVLAGHTLTRSNPTDGVAMYNVGRWGLSGALTYLQAAAYFLAMSGGGA